MCFCSTFLCLPPPLHPLPLPFFLLLSLSLTFCSTFPFICPIISSPLFYKLRWEAGLQEITWVLTHSLFTTTHRRTELTNYIISPRAIHNKLVMGISPVSSLLFLLGKARGNALELQWMSTLVMHADLWRCLSTKGSPLQSLQSLTLNSRDGIRHRCLPGSSNDYSNTQALL